MWFTYLSFHISRIIQMLEYLLWIITGFWECSSLHHNHRWQFTNTTKNAFRLMKLDTWCAFACTNKLSTRCLPPHERSYSYSFKSAMKQHLFAFVRSCFEQAQDAKVLEIRFPNRIERLRSASWRLPLQMKSPWNLIGMNISENSFCISKWHTGKRSESEIGLSFGY